MTQDELAERMEVSKSAISAWENNRESPSFDKLARLQGVLETSLDNLIVGDPETKGTGRLPRAVLGEPGAVYRLDGAEALTRDESRLLRLYREASEKRRRGVLLVLSD